MVSPSSDEVRPSVMELAVIIASGNNRVYLLPPPLCRLVDTFQLTRLSDHFVVGGLLAS